MRESMSAMESAQIWKGRKSAFGATGRIADYICMDGTVPTGRLPEALRRIGEICADYGLRVANVFHAGDGNMHPLILYNVNDPAEQEKAEAAGADVLKMCVELGGCLTGEHGVGIEKRDLMTNQFTAAELAQQKRVRAVFDPAAAAQPGQGVSARGARGVNADDVADAAPTTTRRPREWSPRRAGAARSTSSAAARAPGFGRPPEGARALSTREARPAIVFHEPAEMIAARQGRNAARRGRGVARRAQPDAAVRADGPARALCGARASRPSAAWSRPRSPARAGSAPARCATA